MCVCVCVGRRVGHCVPSLPVSCLKYRTHGVLAPCLPALGWVGVGEGGVRGPEVSCSHDPGGRVGGGEVSKKYIGVMEQLVPSSTG